MKNTALLFLAFPLTFAGCGRAGDGRESFGDKREWSILQRIEYEQRSKVIEDLEKQKVEGHWLICVPNDSNRSRIWIMMSPASAPFYKQIPAGNYTLSKAQLEDVQKTANPTSTVFEALRSHVSE